MLRGGEESVGKRNQGTLREETLGGGGRVTEVEGELEDGERGAEEEGVNRK